MPLTSSAPLTESHKTVVKGTAWGLLGNLGIKLLGLVYLIVVARLFSAGDVGTFYLGLSIMGILAIFTDLGISSALSRYIPYFCGQQQYGKAYSVLRFSLLLCTLLSILVAGLLYFKADAVAAFFRNGALAGVVQVLGIYLVFNTIYQINSFFLGGRKRIKEANALSVLQNFLKLALTVGLFFAFGSTLGALLAAFTLSFLITTAVSQLYIQHELKTLNLPESTLLPNPLPILREIIPFGFTLALTSAIWTLIGYTDRIMLGYFLPEPEAAPAIAIYTLAVSLASLITVFPGAIGAIFFPLISELHGKGKHDEMRHLSASAVRWLLFLSVPLTLLLVVFPDSLLGLLYGGQYSAGAGVLVIFTLATFIRSLSYIQGYLLAALRLVKIELSVALLSVLLNVVLNYLLVPLYGMEGSAVASFVSLACVTLLMTYYSRREFGFGFPRDLHKPLLAGVVGLVPLLLLKGPVLGLLDGVAVPAALPDGGIAAAVLGKSVQLLILAALFALSALVYAAMLLAFRAFHSEDVALAGKILSKFSVPAPCIDWMQRQMARHEAG